MHFVVTDLHMCLLTALCWLILSSAICIYHYGIAIQIWLTALVNHHVKWSTASSILFFVGNLSFNQSIVNDCVWRLFESILSKSIFTSSNLPSLNIEFNMMLQVCTFGKIFSCVIFCIKDWASSHLPTLHRPSTKHV